MTRAKMEAQGPKELVYAWFERIWNQGDESAIDEMAAPHALIKGLPGGTIEGPANFKPFFRAFKGAFPDMKIEITHSVTEGEWCAVHCVVRGTHAGEGIGIAPTNKATIFNGMSLVRVADGQLQEGMNSFDFLSLYQQLGMVPQNPAG